jgi:hypothetical protein
MGNNKLNSIAEEFEQIRNEFREKAKVAVTEAFEECFKTYPELTCISFLAFTPSFNDGEPCLYRVDGFYVSNAKDIDRISSSGELEDEDGEWVYCSWSAKRNNKDFSKVWEIEKFASTDIGEELFSSAFGDGVFVRVTPTEVIIDDYYDY